MYQNIQTKYYFVNIPPLPPVLAIIKKKNIKTKAKNNKKIIKQLKIYLYVQKQKLKQSNTL